MLLPVGVLALLVVLFVVVVLGTVVLVWVTLIRMNYYMSRREVPVPGLPPVRPPLPPGFPVADRDEVEFREFLRKKS